MLNQVVDTKFTSVSLPNNLSITAPSVSNRRFPVNKKKAKKQDGLNLFLFFFIKIISNRTSEHDNRNLIQNCGEYFGRVNKYLNSKNKSMFLNLLS